jgi:anti-sigma factor RsiW
LNHDDAWSLLDSYLDDVLDEQQRWAVATHLGECDRCNSYLANGVRVRAMIRTRLQDVPLPPNLTNRIREQIVGPNAESVHATSAFPRRHSVLMLAAASIALMVVVVWVALRVMDTGPEAAPSVLARELAATHAIFAHDDSLLDVSGDQSAIVSWFADRVSFQIATPTIPGYELKGARLVTVDGRPAAQVVYEDEPTRRYVSLLTFEEPSGMSLHADTFTSWMQRDIAIVIWFDAGLVHALVTGIARAEALSLARIVAANS